MQETGSVLYSDGKNTELFEQPNEGIIQLTPNPLAKNLSYGDTIEIHPERLVWIDIKHRIGVLAAFKLPKNSKDDFSGRIALGTILGHTRRRQYVLAPIDENGTFKQPIHLHSPTLQVIFGRDGMLKKAINLFDESEFISHIPSHDESLTGIMGQVGAYTSGKHLSLSLTGTLLRVKDISEHGSLAYTA